MSRSAASQRRPPALQPSRTRATAWPRKSMVDQGMRVVCTFGRDVHGGVTNGGPRNFNLISYRVRGDQLVGLAETCARRVPNFYAIWHRWIWFKNP